MRSLEKFFLFSLGLFCFCASFARNDTIPEAKAGWVMMGRTVGLLPYLKYGPGTDRLGGAKMTYLDTAIVLQVTDSLKEDYIVRLANDLHAFIPKENVKPDTGYTRKDYYLTSSWTVSGDEKFDYVTIGLDERLPYQSMQLVDPSRIVVDIYGATGNTNWITQLKTAKEVKNVFHEQVADGIFRVNIELKRRTHWGYSIQYRKKALVVKINRPPDHRSIRHLKIAVDAGHGGSNSGATGIYSNVKEKECNLQIAKELEKYLKRRGAEVIMTRDADVDLSMADRILMLREAQPDLLISIHHNASSNPDARGVSTYYRYVGFKPLSESVLNRMLSLGLNNFGNIGSFNFSLSGPTEYPNCLVEVAFLSNTEDEKLILDPHFQRDVARKIRQGVIDWVRKAK